MARRLDDIADNRPAAPPHRLPPEPPDPSGQAARLPRYRSGYSRFVRLMKYSLPVLAGIVVVLVVIWPELASQPDKFRLGLSDLNVETAGGQRVLNARFTGVDRDDRPFSVTASSAIQAPGAKERIDLSEPKADLTLRGDSWVAITSPEGVFWRDSEILDLVGGVELYHDEGYEFRTELARIDFRGGTASGDEAVHGQGQFGTISAEGFRVLDSGERIVFAGKARLVLYPDRTPKGSTE